MKNLTIKHTAALIAFMCFVSVLCVAPQAAFAQPTADAPIDFAMRTDVVGGAPMYYIDVAAVHDQAYQSVNITYPASLYINYPASLSSVWDISSSTGVETITASFILKTGTRSAGELKADLESVFFTLADHAAFPSAGSRITIQASASRVTTFQDADGFLHYYTFVPCTTVNWFEAYNLAKTTYMQDPRYPDDPSRRLQGYLATITSGAEQAKIYGDIAKECGWLGGTRMLMRHDGAPILDPPSLSLGAVFDETYITNAIDDPNTTETQYWYWANGPEAGNIFYLKPKLAGDGAGTPDSGTETANNVPSGFNGWEYFSFWKEHEPNNNVINEPPGEYVLQFAFEGSERWNDYNHANLQDVYGYYVEFGGYLGDPKASEFIKLLSPCSAGTGERRPLFPRRSL